MGAVADASGIAGVNDVFQAEVADTWEVGFKGQFLDRRLNVGVSVFDTESTNGYFFVFLAANSTQNLGNLDADYKGAEFEISAKVTDNFELFGSYGYTDSEITGMEDPSVIGNQAPLVSEEHLQPGRAVAPAAVGDNLALALRADYQHVGETWWEPYNTTSRDPIDLVDLRIGLEGREVGGHGLVEEPHRRGIQRRVLAGWIPVPRAAAALRRGIQLQLLIRSR